MLRNDPRSALAALPASPALPAAPAEYARPGRLVEPLDVLELAARAHRVPVERLRGRSREARLVRARMLASWLLRDTLYLPLASIGDMHGGLDHTSIRYHVARVEERRAVDAAYAAWTADLAARVRRGELAAEIPWEPPPWAWRQRSAKAGRA